MTTNATTAVLYLPQVAQRLGKTEGAMRAMIYRGAADMPPPFKLGGRYAWLESDLDAWLRERANAAGKPRGRAT